VSSPQRSASQTGSLSRRTTSPARTPGPEKRRTPPSRSPPPAAKRTKAEAAKFADNFKAGSRPKAADYEDIVQALLIRAMAEYSVYILTVYAFPDTDMQKKWVRECWRAAGKIAGKRFALSDRMANLVRLFHTLLPF
jgi:hypothetical protein